MRLTHVSLRNFRCFTSLDIDLERCHALIGENGSGKTAVLDAIDLVTSPTLSSSRLSEQDFNASDVGTIGIEVSFSDPFWLKVPDGYTTQAIPCQSVVLSVKRRDKASPGRALSDPLVTEHYAVPVPYGDIASLGVELPGAINVPVSVAKTEEGFELTRKSGKTMQLTPLALTLRNELIGFPNVFIFRTDRDRQARMGFNTLLQKVSRDLNWRFRAKWDQPELLSTWEEFYQRVIGPVEDAKTGRIIRPLQDEARKLLGSDYDDLELSLLDLEQPFSKAFFARRRESNQIEQERLGSGVAIVLAYILLDVVSSLSKEEIVYLIDEPELHLHPQLQHRLFRRFRDASHQTIYATQSDCFVDVSDWGAITRFKLDRSTAPRQEVLGDTVDRNTISDHLDEIKPARRHEVVYSREDNQLFFARKCLLVEGPADKYGVPILAEKLQLTLGELTVISCNGKPKMPYYQLLCRAFEIPYFTLFDLDGSPETESVNERVAGWAQDGARYSFTTSFEDLIGVPRGARPKATTAIQRVEDLKVEEIPAEIATALRTIAEWSTGTASGGGAGVRLRRPPAGETATPV